MTRWLTHGVTLAMLMTCTGCQSSPTIQWANEKIGFTRASQLGGAETLWIMNGDGSGQSPLELGADGNRGLTWSPDGNAMAFESVRDGNSEIYTARVIDTGNDTYAAQDIQRRTTSSADNAFPAWSPDCAWLAFSSNRTNQTYHNIYQLDLTTNSVTPVTTGQVDDLSPAWSPDATKIAFSRQVGDASREIYVRILSSGQEIRLTNNTVTDTDPSWSPAGRIIFARQAEDGSRAALFEMDAVDANGDGNGDHLEPISAPDANEYDRNPEYFRTGKAIVFLRSREAGGKGSADVWKLLIQDGTVMEPLVNLTQTTPQHEYSATWRRNGVCVKRGTPPARTSTHSGFPPY
ncbi:MAG TPA: DPP IV N-terminal domain-containing protein [Nitrospira sp.]|nr:DPP IV N-terminal domain-containing protein [Nitrospira sp.]